MILAERLLRIKESPTIAVNSLANKLKAEGKPVYNLSAGEPDLNTPENAKEAAIAAIKANYTKYTNTDGSQELKFAIRQKFMTDNNLEYDTNQITVSNGGKQVIFNLLMASINEGDEVIIPAPYWTSYPDMVAFCGGKPVIVECGLDTGFKMTPEQLRSSITTKTKWVFINSPSNPTGACYTHRELLDLAAVFLEFSQVNIISDDIYEHIIFDGAEFFNIAQVEPKLYKRTFVVNGVSKAYSMTGWRIGYGAGQRELIQAMSAIQSQSTSNPCSISQAAAVAALSGPQEFLAWQAKIFNEKRDLVLGLLKGINGLEFCLPTGAFYLFIKCSDLFGKHGTSGKTINSSNDFCSCLLEEALVATVPGSAFGIEGFFRISYAASEEDLRGACLKIVSFCEQLTL